MNTLEELYKQNIFIVDAADRRMKYLIDMINGSGGKAYIMGACDCPKPSGAIYVLPPFALLDTVHIGQMAPSSCVFCRASTNNALEAACGADIKIFSYNDDEILVTQNAYLTAEGTLAYIIGNTDEALHELNVLVLGLGRVGKAVTSILRDNYVKIAVASLPITEQALGHIMVERSYNLKDLHEYIEQFNVVVNTVPAMILQGEALRRVQKDALIIDLASAPGGADYMEAKDLGLKIVHYQGVPGHTAPKTAAKFILDSIARRLVN